MMTQHNTVVEFRLVPGEIKELRRAPAYDAIRYKLGHGGPDPDITATADELRAAYNQISWLSQSASYDFIVAEIRDLVSGFPNGKPEPSYVTTLARALEKFPPDIIALGIKASDTGSFLPARNLVVEHCQKIFDESRCIPLNRVENAQAELHRRLGEANELLARADAFEAAIEAVLAGKGEQLPAFQEFSSFAFDAAPRAACTWPIWLRSREAWVAQFARWLVIGFRLDVAASLKPGGISLSQANTIFTAKEDAKAARALLRDAEAATFTESSGRWMTSENLQPVIRKRLAEFWEAGRRDRDELTDEERAAEFFATS
jgi:hypothetical protein